jgi:hypothetical protein
MTSIRFLFVIAMTLLATTATKAIAHSDEIPDDLAAISHNHLSIAHSCRTAIGTSQFNDARIAVENVLRTTGFHADTAISSVDDMVSSIAAIPGISPPMFNECIANLASSKRALLGWQAQFHHLADPHHDAEQP